MYIKTYEGFTYGINIEHINMYLNDKKFMNKIKRLLDSLSSRNREILFDFLSNKINIDKINDYINKFNIKNRVKSLFGINRNINNVIDNVNDVKTESLSGLVVGIIILAIIGLIFDNGGFFKKLIILILAIILYTDIKNDIYIVKDGKEYNLMIVEEPDGRYKAIIIGENDNNNDDSTSYKWHKMTPEDIDSIKGINEGNFVVWGKNEGDNEMMLGIGPTDVANTIMDDFTDIFDKVWIEEEK